MKWIVYKRFKGRCLAGDVNIPYNTELIESDGLLYWRGVAVASTHSNTAHQHFAINDDGQGLKRGRLIMEIRKALGGDWIGSTGKVEMKRQEKWDLIRKDELCQPLRKPGLGGDWQWGEPFYVVPIFILKHIASLIGVGIKT